MKQTRVLAYALGGLLAAAGTASADLVYLGTTNQTGSGVGGQQTLLSFSATGAQNTSASAAIVWNGTGDDILTGPGTQVQTGDNNKTRALGAAGITQGSEFALVWNMNEPGQNGQVGLQNLSVAFYANDGTLLHVANLSAATCPNVTCTFTQVGNGIGTQGHVFGLDTTQAGIVDLFADFANVRVGLGSALSLVGLLDDESGFETFNIAKLDADGGGGGGGGGSVPEPSMLLLLGVALFGMAAFARKQPR